MVPLVAAGLLAGGGAALGGLGGIFGAASQNRAGRQARDFFDMRTGQQQRRLGLMAFGQDWEDLFNGTGFDDPAARARYLGGNKPIFNQMDDLVGEVNKRGDADVVDFKRRTAGLDVLARGNEDLAAEFGRGGEDVIRRDAAKSLKAANQVSAGNLGMLGANSLLANQTSANARNVNDAQTKALVDLSSRRTDKMMGARGDRLNMLGGRDSGLTALSQANIDRRFQTSMMPLQARLALMQGNVMNPWLNQNTSQYYPGASGAANALGTGGNLLSGLGGMYMASQFFGGGGGGGGIV